MNPPGNPRASFRVGTPDAESPDEWLESADTQKDSWWPDYAAWLAQRSGSDKDAPVVLGTNELAPLMPAPGAYVREK